MATRDNQLPLLHKYIFNHDDDLKLKMSKLQYRLCVQEVSHVILGRQAGLDLCDIEPSIVPDFNMTTVEAHPPKLEDFPPASDEGLSSPDSEDYPQKTQTNQDYLYNDSGIIMDESTNNTSNGHYDDDDNISEASSTDPNDYHITRHEEYHTYHETQICNSNTQQDDTETYPIQVNGNPQESQSQETITEESIEPTERQATQAQFNFDQLPEGTGNDERLPEITVDAPVPTEEQEQEDTSESAEAVPLTTPPPSEEEEEEQEEVEEEVIEKREVEVEEELEPEPEVERVDFVPGGEACHDVDTALQILKTRYRLSCSSLKKCIITSPDSKTKRYSAPVFAYERSRWNLQDVVRGPHEEAAWWLPAQEPEPVIEEKNEFGVMKNTIDRKQDEISKLLQELIDEERRKKEKKEKEEKPVPVNEEPVIESQTEPALEAIPEEKETSADDKEPSKKKKGNVFQRMMRALRKRLQRNRHRA